MPKRQSFHDCTYCGSVFKCRVKKGEQFCDCPWQEIGQDEEGNNEHQIWCTRSCMENDLADLDQSDEEEDSDDGLPRIYDPEHQRRLIVACESCDAPIRTAYGVGGYLFCHNCADQILH